MKTDQRHPRLSSWADRIFRGVVRLFPFDFRSDHGPDFEQTMRTQHREARREGSIGALVRLWFDIARDVFTTAPREHLAILPQDVGYALRALRRAPVLMATRSRWLASCRTANTRMLAKHRSGRSFIRSRNGLQCRRASRSEPAVPPSIWRGRFDGLLQGRS